MSRATQFAGLIFSGAMLALVPSVAGAGDFKNSPGSVDWSGIYLGAQAGYGWGDGSLKFLNFPNGDTPDMNGWLGGGQIGYQRQFGSLVVGVEASGLAGNLDGSAPDLVTTGGTISVDIKNMIALNGRLGWAADNWLIYATGGYVRADVDAHDRFPAFSNYDYGTDDHHNGWNIGGGVEYMIARNVSLGLDYRHVELDAKVHDGVYSYTGSSNGNDPLYSHRVDADVDVVSARLNLHLGADDPAPLK
jgi:outer membrane immunogenic protein